jgi:glycine cleavage system aminomethyltransferase T
LGWDISGRHQGFTIDDVDMQGVLRPAHDHVSFRTEGHYRPVGLIERGRARQGETVSIYCGGTSVRCRISNPTFYDPANEKLQA